MNYMRPAKHLIINFIIGLIGLEIFGILTFPNLSLFMVGGIIFDIDHVLFHILSEKNLSLKEFSRDRLAMFWTIGFPVFFILLLGMLFGDSRDFEYNIGISNLDDGPASIELVEIFRSVENINISLGEEESLRVRNRIAQGLAEAGWTIADESREQLVEHLPPDFQLKGSKVIRLG